MRTIRLRLAVGVMTATLLTSAVPAFAQFVQQGPKLVGAGSVPNPRQGMGVALSADGSTAIVGGPDDNGGRGAVWIFTRSNGVWTQQGPKLSGNDLVPQSALGVAVAISADGNTALVGGYHDNDARGAAWIFVRSAGTWAQQGPKLVGTTTSTRAFQGISVALSADGNTALVGGYNDGDGAGAAWVFTRSGSTWTQQGEKLVGTDAIGIAAQGFGVALSADGNTALVGGFADNSHAGAAWVFTRSGFTWSQQIKLTGSGGIAPMNFGVGASLSADGNTAAIGGPGDNANAGAVWTFRRSGGTWTQDGSKLTSVAAGSNAGWGKSVSLSGDGSRMLVGQFPFTGTPTAGGAWSFVRNGGDWLQSVPALVGTGAVGAAQQGYSVAVSSDGLTAISGGLSDNNSTGAAWIFTATNDLRRAGDHDGDMRSDIAVYHIPSGLWSSLTSASNFTGATNRSWGGPAYAAAPGDYDGDGKTDLGLYDPSTGDWYVLLSGANFTTSLSKNVGGPGWTMVPRDFDGDGKTDFAVYNSTTGQWYGLNSSTNYTTTFSMFWGGSNYLQVPADYDGDGKADFGVYNLDTGVWSILLSSTNYTTSLSKSCGGSGWTPVPADYDGDGRADLVVYNYNPGTWYGLKSSGNYLTTLSVSWGGSSYQPVKGDYDGDGKADFAVYVSNTGMWYILLSGANYTTSIVRNWGGSGWAAIPQFP